MLLNVTLFLMCLHTFSSMIGSLPSCFIMRSNPDVSPNRCAHGDECIAGNCSASPTHTTALLVMSNTVFKFSSVTCPASSRICIDVGMSRICFSPVCDVVMINTSASFNTRLISCFMSIIYWASICCDNGAFDAALFSWNVLSFC